MAEVYRETSRTRTPDGDEVYADSDVIVHGRGTTFVVKSLTTNTCKRVTIDASNVDQFYRLILEAKKLIKAHDEREYRRMAMIRESLQKPKGRTKKSVPQGRVCPYCGGSGIETDDAGEDVACRCRGDA